MPTILSEASRVAAKFQITPEQAQKFTEGFIDQLTRRLQDASERTTQIPTFVSYTPDGNESGSYLTVDVGGTNLRVCLVNLQGQSRYDIKQISTTIPPHLMVAKEWEPLFRFIAERVVAFTQAQDETNSSQQQEKPQIVPRALAFTFSFTTEQFSLHSGTLLKWDKGFDIPSAVGKDPCAMLQSQLDLIGAPIQVLALANDTVGTFMAQQYISGGRTAIGAVFGTGANAAYPEKLTAISKMSSEHRATVPPSASSMVINTEFGGMDDTAQLLPRIIFDVALDKNSLHPGEQLFEKMISGMYLGELFRRALMEACQNTTDNSSRHIADSPVLHREYAIPTSLLSVLASCSDPSTNVAVKTALQATFGSTDFDADELRALKILADAIGTRAARLAGVVLAAMLIKSDRLNDRQQVRQKTQFPKTTVSVHSRPHDSPRPMVRVAPVKFFSRSLNLVWLWISRQCSLMLTWPYSATPRRSRMVEPAKDKSYMGLDGSLAVLYPGFIDTVRETFRGIDGIGIEGERRIQIDLVRDASSLGSALIACAAQQQLAGLRG